DAGDDAADPRECAPVADVYGADLGGGAAVLPVDRRQDCAVPGEGAAPVLSGAGGAEHARGVCERHVDEPADGGAGGDGAVDSRPRECGDAAAWICDRV